MINIANADYSKLKKEYVMGNVSYRELASKYGIPFGSLRKVAAKEKWAQLRTQARTKADIKIVDAIAGKEAARLNKINDVTDKLLDKISTIIDTIEDTQGIKHISSALKDIKEIKGLKSATDMREQEARIKKLEREAKMGEESTEGSGVVYMPSVDGELRPPEEADDE